MATLDGRVAIVTGAGRGLGRAHALLLAREGAKVVVNDLGGSGSGTGADRRVAEDVVDEIAAIGGDAVANSDSVADWEGAKRLVRTAIESFGSLHILVNNAGILRDRMLVNMTEGEWDAVINVHLKGTFCPTRHAATYWREQVKAGNQLSPRIINTSSTSGLFNNLGQTNYGAAKSAIASFTMICAKELRAYGVRSNAIAPAARTRLTQQTPGLDEAMRPPASPQSFDVWDPMNVSPVVGYLATERCPFNGCVFHVQGGIVTLLGGWNAVDRLAKSSQWTVEELATEADRFLAVAPDKEGFLLSETFGLQDLTEANGTSLLGTGTRKG